jgi:Cupin superfamily protein
MNGTLSEDHQMDDDKGESLSLTCILGDSTGTRVPQFFNSIWQEQCAEFRWRNRHSLLQNNRLKDDAVGNPTEFHAANCWNNDAMRDSPFEELINQGWNVLVQLLADSTNQQTKEGVQQMAPLLFRDQVSVTSTLASSYNNNLMAAYLDGCSVVLNHADWSSPWIASVCQDLQRSFPHVYANVYITPPEAQAVPAHADDRDVLIIQVVGKKQWTVYQKVPIPHPYPPEQVGKEGLDVPAEVLEGPTLIQTILNPGDVLYMPRGYVHEAQTHEDNLSFHVTIALATHDWTLAGILTAATEKILHGVVSYRKAIHRNIGVRDLKDISVQDQRHLQKQIQEAFQLVQEQVTVEAISENLGHKFHRHNHRAYSVRMKLIHAMRFPSVSVTPRVNVGSQAAKMVSLGSLVRAATPEEKALVVMDKPRGLLVRAEVADAIIFLLKALKESQSMDGLAVKDLKSLLETTNPPPPNARMICQLTLLSFARVCVEQGALAIVHL